MEDFRGGPVKGDAEVVGELEHANGDLHQVLQISVSSLQDSRDLQFQLDAFSLGLCKLTGLVKILVGQYVQLGSLIVDDSVPSQDSFLGLGQDDGCSRLQTVQVLFLRIEEASVATGVLNGNEGLGASSCCGSPSVPAAPLTGSSRASG